jgi:hypothetical protein
VIHKRTHGIPRFVEHAITYIFQNCKNNTFEDEKTAENTITHLLGDQFRYYVRPKAFYELNPFHSLPENLQNIYINLIIWAVLEIPFDLDAPVKDPKLWGLPDITSFTVGDLVQILNLYIQPVLLQESKRLCKVVFSELIIDELVENYSDIFPMIPFFASFYKIMPEMLDSGYKTEVVGLRALCYRLGS